MKRTQCRGRTWTIVLLFLCAGSALAVQAGDEGSDIVRHPFETRALVDPRGVLAELPERVEAARAANDFTELALLHLAEANACRVIADLPCQRDAGTHAYEEASRAGDPQLQIRALIAESRGRMAMQDYSAGETRLGEAERILELHPSASLAGDVQLAYSSLSYALGKNALARDYAEKGLELIGTLDVPPIRVRLLRNQARAMAQLGDRTRAEAVLREALVEVARIDDPKLQAELHLEVARIARIDGNTALQERSAQEILSLSRQLQNSQLTGLAHEVLGLSALDSGRMDVAEDELRQARASFAGLKLERDERRVLRALLKSLLGRTTPAADLEPLVGRLVELESGLEAGDRAQASDDFEARLRYAQQEFDVQSLKASVELARQRQVAADAQRRLVYVVAISGGILVAVLLLSVRTLRRANGQLKQAMARVQESESRYRMLADNSRDMVVRMRLDGERVYVSPASKDLLGLDPGELKSSRWDLVHPDDREPLAAAIKRLGRSGGSDTLTYRASRPDGSWVWIEALARLVEEPEGGGPPEIVYSGRDITARVQAEQSLARSEARIRAITDNIPALIAHIDRDQRYLFANAFIGTVFNIDTTQMIGRTMREVRGEKTYAHIRPYVEAALRGEPSNFEGRDQAQGKLYHYRSSYMPDRGPDGSVVGFYALTFDITELKQTQAELHRLARVDSLSGVANRRSFEERLAAAIAHCRREGEAIALLVLDLDRFKAINDGKGHAAGDAAIVEFARRIRACVRENDLVARLGGDEFAVLLDNPTLDGAQAAAGKILAAMREPMLLGGAAMQMSTSIGVAFGASPEEAETLLHLADEALYAAKDAGRATFATRVHVPARNDSAS